MENNYADSVISGVLYFLLTDSKFTLSYLGWTKGDVMLYNPVFDSLEKN